MGLEEKLHRMCVVAHRNARRRLQRHMKDLSLLVAAALKTGKWADLPIKTQREIRETAYAAVEVAGLADAADFVNGKVLTANHGKVFDLKTGPNFDVIQERILDLFESRQAPRRGFVYVAWSARPEKFLYVGRGKDTGRLSLDANGKLAHAVASASTVSLLFPAQSRPKTLGFLEACVIGLIEEATGKLPELNRRRECPPMGDSLQKLVELGSFLAGVAKRLTPLVAD